MSAGEAANPARGESALTVGGKTLTLRPSFGALVAAEQELGPLFAVVEKAASGQLGITDAVALIWHCLWDRPDGLTRDKLADAIVEAGLMVLAPVLRGLLGQILKGL